MLIVTRTICQSYFESQFGVIIMFLKKKICAFWKHFKNFVINILKFFKNAFRLRFFNIRICWNWYTLEPNTCKLFNSINKFNIFTIVESDACSWLSSSSCSSRSMNVWLSIFWWFKLNYKFNVRYVEASWSYISCNKNLKFVLFKPFHCYFSLVLSDISMHCFNILCDRLWE